MGFVWDGKANAPLVLLDLRLETPPLLSWVGEFGEGVCNLSARNEELESFRHTRSLPVRLGEWGYLNWMVDDEGGLLELWLAHFLKNVA